MDVSSTAESFLNPMVYHQVDDLTELDDGKIYRKPLYFMVKPMVSCRYSLKPIHWWSSLSSGYGSKPWSPRSGTQQVIVGGDVFPPCLCRRCFMGRRKRRVAVSSWGCLLCIWSTCTPGMFKIPKKTHFIPGDSTMKLVVWLKLVLVDYTLWLCQNSYWKWPFIVDLPIKNGDFP